jgi:MFS transporter, ACS family, aldohexuronate transporter
MKIGKGLRWKIVWILFFSTVLNYVNRQTFSLLAPVISSQLHFSHEDLARVFGAFQITYAWTWLLGGVFLDFVGARLGLTVAVVWWSIASILSAAANSLQSFVLCRALLGVGEGMNWPGASKVVAEWFPAKERAVAVAIFDSGSSIGAAVAAISIPLVALKFGWRSAFVLSGLFGVVWLALWLRTYHPVERHPKLSAEELSLIRETSPPAPSRTDRKQLLNALKDRNTWGILLGRSLTDPMWWFFVFWLPQYLSEARGFSLSQLAAFSWIPFLAADLGNFTGGLLSGRLIRSGIPVMRARKLICIVSCAPMLAGVAAAIVNSPYLALFCICLALWGYAAWSTMGLTFPSDLFEQNVVASVTGLSGFGAGMAGTAVTLIAGWIVDRYSYVPAFVFVTALPLLATVAVLLLIRERRAVRS